MSSRGGGELEGSGGGESVLRVGSDTLVWKAGREVLLCRRGGGAELGSGGGAELGSGGGVSLTSDVTDTLSASTAGAGAWSGGTRAELLSLLPPLLSPLPLSALSVLPSPLLPLLLPALAADPGTCGIATATPPLTGGAGLPRAAAWDRRRPMSSSVMGPLTFRGALGLNVDNEAGRTFGATLRGRVGVTGRGAAYGEVDLAGDLADVFAGVFVGVVFVLVDDDVFTERLLLALLDAEGADVFCDVFLTDGAPRSSCCCCCFCSRVGVAAGAGAGAGAGAAAGAGA